MKGSGVTVDLSNDAVAELGQVVKSEVLLAREELGEDVRRLGARSVALGATAVLTVVGVELLLGAVRAIGARERRRGSALAVLGIASLGLGAAVGRAVARELPRDLARARELAGDGGAVQDLLG